MTAHSPDTMEQPSEARDTLWVTDAELIRRLGSPRDITRAVLAEYDRNPHSGFPRKQKLWGDRRYWPAVIAFLDHQYGLKIDVSPRRKAS